MQRFKNILVGVDLSDEHRKVSDSLVAPTKEAIGRSLSLAKANSARLTFVYVLDEITSQLSADKEILLEESHGQRSVVDHANEVLAKLVGDAREQGVTAEGQVLFGSDWKQIIRQVLRQKHDLVVVGTRQLGSIKRMFLGSTGRQLLRKCPCPVWITKPGPNDKYERVLAAVNAVCHDEAHSYLNKKVLELATSLCNRAGSQLDVIQAWSIHGSHLLEDHMENDEFKELVDSHWLDVQGCCDDLLRPYDLNHDSEHVHVVRGDPVYVIPNFIKDHKTELIVMGTVARGGIAGVLMGNTAEAILGRAECSVLAIKPNDFVSPIRIDD